MREINNINDLEEIQTIEYGILKSITEFCKRTGLRYYLAYGTLIGAVRHKGFIPWDDDIDILMPRGDFERFIQTYADVASGLTCDGRFRLGYLNTIRNYNRVAAKVYDTRTRLNETDRDNHFDEGLFVDIWPLDGTPDRKIFRVLHLRRLRVLNTVLAASIKHEYTGKSRVKQLVIGILMPICKLLVKPEKLVRHIASISGNKAYRSGKYLINPIAPELFQYKREWFYGSPRQMFFQDAEFSVPSDPHNVLHVQYGDYMQYPKTEEQHPHHLFTASICE